MDDNIKSLLKFVVVTFLIGAFFLSVGYGAGKFFESLEKELRDSDPIRIMVK